jgi:protein SCO1/2
MTPRVARVLLIVAAFMAGLVTVLAAIMVMTGSGDRPLVQASAIGGPFRLVDQDGKPFTEQDLKGKPTLIFFGFTHCPEICPTKLFEVSEVLRALGPDADRARALFITVDPERDTPAAMKDYIASFDPHLRALSGDADAIAGVLKAYRVYAKKVPLEGGTYTMDHTAIVYLMDKDGRFVAPFNLKGTPQQAAAELRKYL